MEARRTFSLPPRTLSMHYRKGLRLFLILVCVAVLATPGFAEWASGVEAFKQGNYPIAEVAFAAEADSKPDWFGGHLMLGRTRLELGRTAEALASLERAWHLSPENSEIAILLAHTALDAERPQLAAEALLDGPAENLEIKQRARWHQLRASAAVELGKPAEALGDFAQASRLNPDDFLLRYAHGSAALQAGQTELAFSELESALRLEPKRTAVHQRLLAAWLVRLEQLQSADRGEACHAAFARGRQLVSLDARPSHLLATGRLGLCAGQVDDAQPYFAKLLASGEWQGGYYLGRSQIVQHRFDDAVVTLQPMVAQGDAGQQRRVHQLLGLAREATGAYDAAIEHYRAAADAGGAARAEANKAHRDEEPLRRMLEEMRRLERDLENLNGLEVSES